MPKKEYNIEDFLYDVRLDNTDCILQLHNFLIESGCVMTMKAAASGHVVSYALNKKVIANFVSRKKGPMVRIYGDNINKYLSLAETMPDGMLQSVAKAPACKRLLNPADCNSRCSMGYDFTLQGVHHQKCKYNCFFFEISAENFTVIKDFLASEVRERAA